MLENINKDGIDRRGFLEYIMFAATVDSSLENRGKQG
jgi:hypothetical protein